MFVFHLQSESCLRMKMGCQGMEVLLSQDHPWLLMVLNCLLLWQTCLENYCDNNHIMTVSSVGGLLTDLIFWRLAHFHWQTIEEEQGWRELALCFSVASWVNCETVMIKMWLLHIIRTQVFWIYFDILYFDVGAFYVSFEKLFKLSDWLLNVPFGYFGKFSFISCIELGLSLLKRKLFSLTNISLLFRLKLFVRSSGLLQER